MTDADAGSTGTAQPIPSLPRQRLADQIADVLREQMLTGSLQPGEAIHEREMAEALGVSRTPLREAVLILEAEGLVKTSPARSPVVAKPSLKEITDLLIVQSGLEALAGELACEHATQAELDAISTLHEEMLVTDGSPDTIGHFRTDMAFHEAIVRATKNKPLIKTHKQYNSRLWRARYMTSRMRFGRAASMADHAAVVAGLQKRDAAAASSKLRAHLGRAIAGITVIFQAEDQPDTK